MAAKAEVLAVVLAASLLATMARAEEPPADEPLPDPGFLEFLGLLVEDEDSYLDPLDMATGDWTEADHQAATEARPGTDPGVVEDDDEPRN